MLRGLTIIFSHVNFHPDGEALPNDIQKPGPEPVFLRPNYPLLAGFLFGGLILAEEGLKSVGAAKAYCLAESLPDPLDRFKANKRAALRRGIDWELTFDEWWALWKDSFHLRGNYRNQMNLCRYLDLGIYSASNVRVDLAVNNHQERATAKRLRTPRIPHGARPEEAMGNHSSFRDPLEILMEREEEAEEYA